MRTFRIVAAALTLPIMLASPPVSAAGMAEVCAGGDYGGKTYPNDLFYPSAGKYPHLHCSSKYIGYHEGTSPKSKTPLADGRGQLDCGKVTSLLVGYTIVNDREASIVTRLKTLCGIK